MPCVMDAATIIAIFIGCINLVALVFVVRQTRLTHRLIQTSERVKQISDLPEVDAVIQLRIHIEEWKADLEQIIANERYIRAQVQKGDSELGKKYGLDTPRGLIIKPIYDELPRWMQVVLMTAAQYYYNCKVLASCLSSNQEPQSTLRLLPEVIDRAKIGVSQMTESLSYIDDMAPQWYLNSPASIAEREFMDR